MGIEVLLDSTMIAVVLALAGLVAALVEVIKRSPPGQALASGWYPLIAVLVGIVVAVALSLAEVLDGTPQVAAVAGFVSGLTSSGVYDGVSRVMGGVARSGGG